MGIWDSVIDYQKSLGKPYASQWADFEKVRDRLQVLTDRGYQYTLIPDRPGDNWGEIRIHFLDTEQKPCHDGSHE